MASGTNTQAMALLQARLAHMNANKYCNKCRQYKPLDAFSNRGDGKPGKRSQCKKCRSSDNTWAENNRERSREQKLKWHADNPDYTRKQRAKFQAEYGVSYAALHYRVYAARGAANTHECACGQQAYDWANLTGEHDNINDYAPMCRKCHRAQERRTA